MHGGKPQKDWQPLIVCCQALSSLTTVLTLLHLHYSLTPWGPRKRQPGKEGMPDWSENCMAGCATAGKLAPTLAESLLQPPPWGAPHHPNGHHTHTALSINWEQGGRVWGKLGWGPRRHNCSPQTPSGSHSASCWHGASPYCASARNGRLHPPKNPNSTPEAPMASPIVHVFTAPACSSQ